METAKIYVLKTKEGIPFYIGQTTKEKNRLKSHMERFGYDITMEILMEVDYERRLWWENHYIKTYKDKGYDLKNKGPGDRRKVILAQIKKAENSRLELSKEEKKIITNVNDLKNQRKLINELIEKNKELRKKISEYRKSDNGNIYGIKRDVVDEVISAIKAMPSPIYLKTTMDTIHGIREKYNKMYKDEKSDNK